MPAFLPENGFRLGTSIAEIVQDLVLRVKLHPSIRVYLDLLGLHRTQLF